MKISSKAKWLGLVLATAFSASVMAADDDVKVDIPVQMKDNTNVVFNMGHSGMAGDMPTGFRYMGMLSDRLKAQKIKHSVIGVFHADDGYMLLNDELYNKLRKVKTGNPYKSVIAELQEKGVQLEECAVTMKGNGWKNADLLPGIKVNQGAIGRLIQLSQDGYVQIQP